MGYIRPMFTAHTTPAQGEEEEEERLCPEPSPGPCAEGVRAGNVVWKPTGPDTKSPVTSKRGGRGGGGRGYRGERGERLVG